MSVALVIILSTLLAVLSSASHSFALPACSGQRFYLKSGEGLTVEFSRKPGCDVRFMTVERGSVERQLFYPSGKSNRLALTGGQQDAPEAWSELPTKAYLRANAETVVRFLGERPIQSATQSVPMAAPTSAPKPIETPITISVENKTNESITHYWVDPFGREINYGNIPPATSRTVNTFDRHVWRIKRTSTNQTIRQFAASSATRKVSIEPGDLPAMPTANKAPSQSWFQGLTSSAPSPFSLGGRITTIDVVNVRSTPTTSASFVGVVQNRQNGTIIDGPHSQDGYTWWRIRYDNRIEGWTADKFIRIAAAGEPRQQPQAINPWSQPSGGTSMQVFSDIWNFIVLVFWLGIIGALVYAVVKMINAGPSIIFSHWHTLIENLQESPMAFYQSLEQFINARQVPKFDASPIDLPEGGVFSPRRKYLRVRREDLIIDICAAPFGTGFFVSWWLGPNLGFLGFLYSLPVVGIAFQYLTRPWTYYRADTALMFRDAIHNAVQEVIDNLTTAKGLRSLSETERKPVMRDFFNK
jgi:hypothetical protein